MGTEQRILQEDQARNQKLIDDENARKLSLLEAVKRAPVWALTHPRATLHHLKAHNAPFDPPLNIEDIND